MNRSTRSAHWPRLTRFGARLPVWVLTVLGGVLPPGPAQAQEFYVHAGAQHTPELDEDTYAFSFAYEHPVADYAYLSFSWLNEGHVTDHHRDGHSTQFWLRKLNAARRLDLAIGVGPYRYFDTTSHPHTTEHVNDHGFGMMYSVAAHWYIRAPWVVQLRYNRVQTSSSIDTDTLVLGAGYQFASAQRPGPVFPAPSYGFASPERNQVSVMLGSTTVNDFQSPSGTAWTIEYRRILTPYVDASLTAIDEGEARVIKRRGLAAQAWLGRRFLDQQAVIAIGVGVYVARDDNEQEASTRALGLLTMSASYQIAPAWIGRVSWHRTVTTHNRDSDIIVAGIARQF